MTDHQLTKKEERLFAAISHLSAIFPFIGMVVPVIIWATQKENSKYVSFQALQAAAYQLMLFLLTFFGAACYGLVIMFAVAASFVGIISTPLISIEGNNPDTIPLLTLLSFLPTFLPFVLFGLFFILGIGAVIYACVAAIMTFNGRDFRYVVIGKRVERYLQQE